MSGYYVAVDRFRPVIRQRWSSATFLHFRFDPGRVQRLVPARVRVEEMDGSAWVSIVAFRSEGTRLHAAPPVGLVPDYAETNVRTYVRTGWGARAVWFFSLEVDSPVVVAAARSLLLVPYRWASMRVEAEPGRCRYVSRRRRGRPVGHRIEVEVGPELEGSEITELDVHLEEDLLDAAGLGAPASAPDVRWSPGVDAGIGLPHRSR